MKVIDTQDSKYFRSLRPGMDYALCIGAGVCFRILPTWNELTRRVVNRIFATKLSPDEFFEMYQNIGWGLDSLLQAALNFAIANGKSVKDYNNIISEELYIDILQQADKFGVKDDFEKLISDPFRRDPDSILKLCDFFEKTYSDTSLYKLAIFLIKAKEQNIAPKAIIDFNADVLLHTLLTLFQLKNEYAKSGKLTSAEFYYRGIHRIGESDGGMIPIYHLHGSIVPLEGQRENRENLIFPEAAYSEIAGSTYSWQQNLFQYHAQKHRMVFIGLSMSDPNIRKWMAWSSANINKENFNRTGKKALLQRNVWITTKPKSPVEESLKAYGLQHLGTRVGFLDSWTNIDRCLDNLFGIV